MYRAIQFGMTSDDKAVTAPYPVRFEPIARVDGINPAERYLQSLCEGTFLRLWSYPGVHRDQGGGKEVADLIVVFGDDVIIFSDKSCAFGSTGNLATDWGRWYRRSVRASAKQVWAAEKWILKHPEKLFLDVGCTKPFPLQLPPAGRARVHRVVVAHGVADACRASLGGSGSLMYSPMIGDNDAAPFTVGDLDPARGFVHILDDTTLEILLTTLDTVADFIAYLREKESWVREGHLLGAAGEEELLAWYLMSGDKNGHALPRTDEAISVLPEGEWKNFLAGPHRRAQVEANAISYAWDGLIGEFERHFINGTSEFRTHADVKDLEPMLRYLASEDRTRRRGLATQLLAIIRKPVAPDRRHNMRVAATEDTSRPAYVFLALARSNDDATYDEYRELRRRLTEGYVLATRLRLPEYKTIIGIATEPHVEGAMRSEDLYLLREEDWSPELEAEAQRMVDLGMLQQTVRSEWREVEYPVEPRKNRAPVGPLPPRAPGAPPPSLNRPCPCGSGHKFKKCHGKT